MSFFKYLFFLFCEALFAQDLNFQKVLSFSGNIAWVNPGQTQTFFLQPDLEQTYNSLSTTNTIGSFEGFLGLQKCLTSNIDAQLGVSVVGATSTHLNGDIWQDANPNFNNYYYSYQLQHTHVAAKGKLLYKSFDAFSPYISASIGGGFNYSSNYLQASKLYEVLEQPTFNNQTITSFIYTLGAGIQTKVYQCLFFNIGYEFADWGKSALGTGVTQDNTHTIQLNHFYANQLQFGLSLIV